MKVYAMLLGRFIDKYWTYLTMKENKLYKMYFVNVSQSKLTQIYDKNTCDIIYLFI